MNQEAATLALRIRSQLVDIAQIVERAQRLLSKAIEQEDDDYRFLQLPRIAFVSCAMTRSEGEKLICVETVG